MLNIKLVDLIEVHIFYRNIFCLKLIFFKKNNKNEFPYIYLKK